MKIGSRLKEIRKEKGYTQERLAEELGISRQAVAKWEADTSYPSTENLMLLASILDVDLSELVAEEHSALMVRRIENGNILLLKDVFVVTERHLALGQMEKRYLIKGMSEISMMPMNILSFRYAGLIKYISLGRDNTDWVGILHNAQNGIYPEPEEAISTKTYILKNYTKESLIEATKYYLDMEGGTRKNAVEAVREILI